MRDCSFKYGHAVTLELTLTKYGEIGFIVSDNDEADFDAKACYLDTDQARRVIEWLADAIDEAEECRIVWGRK